MLDPLETLVALADAGTMTRAATRLRVSQSAVTKRIATLEAELSVSLVERDGRHVRLTAAAEELVARTRPLLSELRAALRGQRELTRGKVVLGVSESVLSSWGPRVLARVRTALPEVALALHTHRSPVAVDHVRAGEYTLALVAGGAARTDGQGGLFSEVIHEEAMVLVGMQCALVRGMPLRVTTIEAQSETFRALAPQLKALRKCGVLLEVERELQSFAAIVQLARAGFGPALVPLPLARALGVPRDKVLALPKPFLRRPICLIGKKSVLARPLVAAFCAALRESVARENLQGG